jgi:hypothetical protein
MNGSFLGLALINGWYIPWVNLDKIMVHSLGWTGQEEESWWKIGIVVGKYQLG